MIAAVVRLEHQYLIAYTCQMDHDPGVQDLRPRALAPDAGGAQPSFEQGGSVFKRAPCVLCKGAASRHHVTLKRPSGPSVDYCSPSGTSPSSAVKEAACWWAHRASCVWCIVSSLARTK